MELFDSSRIDCFILSDDQKGAFPDICISEPAIGNCPKPPAAAGCEEIGQFMTPILRSGARCHYHSFQFENHRIGHRIHKNQDC